MKKITSMILALVFAVSVIGSASAKTLKIQLTFPKTSYDGQIVKMWTDRVTKLTRGELKFELLSKGEVVGMKETLFPATIAGAIFATVKNNGAFQGTIAQTTPIGSLVV